MAIPLVTGGIQGLGVSQEDFGRRGGLGVHQGCPKVDRRHQCRDDRSPECNLQELFNLLAIPTTQRKMGRKDLEHLVEKLRSIHLAVPGAVAHIYHIQHVLTQAEVDRAWLFPYFHREIADWRTLADHTAV